jgi:alkylation response protein AidB-like acyl-CoA dehydrogenase
MRLSLSDEQEDLRRTFAGLFARESPPQLVRASESTGFAPSLWKALAATGITTMAFPGEAGGADAALLECAVVAEQAGHHLAPVPLAEHVAAGRAIAAAGATAALRRLVDAGEPATLALQPLHGGTHRVLLPAGAVARHVVVLDATGRLLLVEREPALVAVPNLAGLPLAELDPVDAGASATVLTDGAEAARAFAAGVAAWHLLTSAMLVGLAEQALALGVAYVREREQFGRPIGSFQAIQHGLAEFPGRIAGARLLAARAAWAADHADPDAERLARASLLFAAETAQAVTGRALHYHGGYGVMAEYDIQLYHRRAKGWPLQAGDPAHGYRTLADLTYGPGKGV